MDNIAILFQTTSSAEWGPAIPQYFFFTGISAAAFLISSLAYVFHDQRFRPVAGLSLILALTVLMAAPLNLIADLGQTGRFYSLFFRIHLTSPMSWGVFLLTLYPLLIAIEALFAFRSAFARKAQHSSGILHSVYRLLAFNNLTITTKIEARDHRMSRILGSIGIPMALAVHGYTGFILYFAVGRPLWNTPLMPIIFLVSAVVSGLAMMILLTWLMVRDPQGKQPVKLMEQLGILLGWTILADLALRGLWHSLAYLANPDAYGLVLTYLFKDHFVESVVLELGVCLVFPALVMFVPALRKRKPVLLLAAILTFIGVYLFRWDTVIGGQQIPKFGDLFSTYSPVLWGGKGILQVIGNWAFWLFLFILATSFLPWRMDEDKSTEPIEAAAGQVDQQPFPLIPNTGKTGGVK